MASPTTDRRYGVNSSAAIKVPVRAATTANITLSGLQTIDGIALGGDDRVLVKNQTTTVDNGIYVAGTGTWTRAIDFNGNRDVVQGTLVYVTSGTTQGGSFYQVTTPSPITIGSSALVFAVSVAAGSLATQLASAASSSYGAGMVGYLASLPYAAGTVGSALNDGNGVSLMSFVTSQSERAAIVAGTSVVDYTATLNSALALYSNIYIPAGTWNFSSDVSLPDSTVLRGAGRLKTKLVFASGKGIILSSASARCVIEHLWVQGTGKTGTGIKVGDTDFCGQHTIQHCRIIGFATGVRFSAALWTMVRECLIDGNNRGIDFNAGAAGKYSTTILIDACCIRANDNEGIAATNVPVRNQSIIVRGGSIESNCSSSPGTTSQHVTGDSQQYTIDNVFYEASGGTKPNAIDISLCGGFDIMCFINGSRYGITSGVASAGPGVIHDSRMFSDTACVFVNGGVNAVDIQLRGNIYDKANTLAGTRCYDYSAVLPAPWAANETAWTPVLSGAGVAGAPTYAAQAGTYTRVGNRIYFDGRVSISAIGGMVGDLQVSLPVAPRATTANLASVFTVEFDGVTFAAGRTQLNGKVVSNMSIANFISCGSGVAPVALTSTNASTSTSFFISGHYPV